MNARVWSPTTLYPARTPLHSRLTSSRVQPRETMPLVRSQTGRERQVREESDIDNGGSPYTEALDPDLVECIVITTANLSRVSSVAQALRDCVSSSQLRILDLVAVETDALGHYSAIEFEHLPGLEPLDGVEGEVGGFLSDDDIALACSALVPGTSALILLVEDRWAGLLADAARLDGGRIAGGERIPRHRLEQSSRSRRRQQAGD